MYSVILENKSTWWRHQMERFSASLALCAGNSPITGEFPAQRPVPRSFAVFFDLRLNKRLSKQPWGWRFETRSWSLWRHSNEDLAITSRASAMKQTAICKASMAEDLLSTLSLPFTWYQTQPFWIIDVFLLRIFANPPIEPVMVIYPFADEIFNCLAKKTTQRQFRHNI